MSLLSVSEIEQRLREHAESIARECIPNGIVDGNYFKAGDVHGGPGDSLVLYLQGERQGTWRHWAGTDAGDMLDLIEKSMGLAGKGEAVAEAKRMLGIEDDWRPGAARRIDPAEQARRAAQLARDKAERQRQADETKALKIKRAKAFYLSPAARPIAGTPAEAYLLGRGRLPGADGEWPGVLRFHPEAWCKEARVKVPAMIAAVYRADGSQIATHRTFLQPCPRRGWTKLDVKEPRKVLGPSWGGFIPIHKGASGKAMARMPEGEAVYMAEGIEKCIAIRELRPEFRIIAGINVGNMGAVVLPPAAKRLVIVADRDEKQSAVDALERTIAQQAARGLDVRLVVPPRPYKDIDEWVDAARAAQAGQDLDLRGDAA